MESGSGWGPILGTIGNSEGPHSGSPGKIEHENGLQF